jgi:MFS transporter, FSR family, fosmidomycin resistance protein
MKQTVFKVLFALSFSHLLNDAMQALIPAIYPILKESYHLTLAQCGCITLTFQVIASLLQPLVGHFSDLKPRPLSLAAGMASTFVGLLVLSQAASYGVVLIAAGLVGLGSSVFHPEASRVAKMASGGRPGLAQSVFQVGGNAGSALGPILAALVVVKYGQGSVAWFCLAALAGIVILMRVGSWQRRHLVSIEGMLQSRTIYGHPDLSRATVVRSILILLALIFSKYFYLVSISNYYTFYLIAKFHMDIRSALYCLFAFMGAVAAGTIIGGPVGDRFGRKYVIWASILGVAPFTLILPHVGLTATILLSIVIGVILSSAFSAILVYAQELLPGRVGLVAGLFFGFAFGMGGIGSAVLGALADRTSISYVYQVCAYLPLIGLLTAFLPNLEKSGRQAG